MQQLPILESTLICPVCGFTSVECMPSDACVILHECAGCHTELRPRVGDCCVFCSYGSVKCPPVQRAMSCCGSAGTSAFLANAREYADGDIETDARYYRAHFSKTLRRSDQLESIVRRLRALPRAGLVVLGECGHFSYLERPSEVLGAIAEFAITTPVPR